MSYVVHALPKADWRAFEESGEYRPDSLSDEGFVHCSKLGQIVLVADYYHAAVDDLVLLLLDESRIDAPIRYETDGDDGKSAFPTSTGRCRWTPSSNCTRSSGTKRAIGFPSDS